MARKKKSSDLSYDHSYFPASMAAEQAINNHPGVSDLRQGLTKAISGTIKRYLSHKPLVKKLKRK